MKYIIDTSSLHNMIKYYLRFDQTQVMYDHLKESIAKGDIIFLDAVYEECKFIDKGSIIEKFDFLKEKEFHTKTTTYLPDGRFQNRADANWMRKGAKSSLLKEEIEVQRRAFFESADTKIILYCMNELNHPACVITEETQKNNDGKLYLKLPAICQQINTDVINIVTYLDEIAPLNLLIQSS